MHISRLKKPLIAICLVAASVAAISATGLFRLSRNMGIMANMMRDIEAFYVDTVNPDHLLAAAAEGMTSILDPYTEFIDEDGMEDFEVMTTGRYGGIGALIRQKGEWVQIAQPYKGFPADKAGLQIGDKILEINGKSVKNFDTQRVSSLLKGEAGTTLRLKVEKFFTGEEQTLTLRRERIHISGVPYYGMVSGDTGYILLSDFTDDCSSDVHRALDALRAKGAKKLILDVRGNGGGILEEAVKIMALFVPKGTEVVSMRGRLKESDAVYRTQTDAVDTLMRIAVLTNSNSASAAEIVAGAMQDLDRATLVGQRTFGKGLVQSPRPLGYNTYLKITTAKYYIPSGRCIQAIDYAQRNEDGSVSYIPDSLMKPFKTRNGRTVYDGGGIDPDVKTEPRYLSRFASIVYAMDYVGDFCDEWLRKNGPVGADFTVTDKIYDQFSAFMADKKVDYESETMRALKLLKTVAERERYSEKIGQEIDALEQSLKEDKQLDLKLYREELSDMIEDDMLLRFFYMDGVIAHKLKKDPDVLKALETLGK